MNGVFAQFGAMFAAVSIQDGGGADTAAGSHPADHLSVPQGGLHREIVAAAAEGKPGGEGGAQAVKSLIRM